MCLIKVDYQADVFRLILLLSHYFLDLHLDCNFPFVEGCEQARTESTAAASFHVLLAYLIICMTARRLEANGCPTTDLLQKKTNKPAL